MTIPQDAAISGEGETQAFFGSALDRRTGSQFEVFGGHKERFDMGSWTGDEIVVSYDSRVLCYVNRNDNTVDQRSVSMEWKRRERTHSEI